MSATRVIEGTIGAWLPDSSSLGPKELAEQPGDKLVRGLSYSAWDMTPHGWTRIGEARVEVTLKGRDELIASKVDALRALRTHKLAETQREVTEIDKQINTLLAIEFDGTAS